ncbi:MAG: hypothetical protein ABI687_13505, partial [Flavitalea sp.]
MRILFIYLLAIIWLQSCSGKTSVNESSIDKTLIPVKLLPIHSDTSSNVILASGLLSTENEARLSF